MLGVFAAFLAILPVTYLVMRLAQGLDAALLELLRPRTLELLINTVLLVMSVSVTALAIGVFQAWFIVRTQLPWPGLFALLATVPLAIPSYVLALGYVSVFPWFSGFWASWLVLSLATSPYVFLSVAAALMRSDVASEEVARSLGLNSWSIFWKVTWPQLRTSTTASSLLVSLYVLAEFGGIAILRYDTFTRAIYNAYRSSFDRTAAAALAVVLVVITVLILLIERRFRTDYLALKTSNAKRLRKTIKVMPLVVASLSIIGLLAVILPLGSLINWTVVGGGIFDFSLLVEALANSVLVSLAASVMIAVFGMAMAIWLVLHRQRLATLCEGIIWSNHALPALVIALSLVFFGANSVGVLYQSIWLLLIAYLILFLPNAMAAMVTPLSQVPMALTEVSRSLRKNYGKTLRKVVLPIAQPGLVAAIALAMLTVVKELPATLLLRPTGTETLATRLWQATEELAYSQAAPYALTLVIIAGLPALALNASVRATYRGVSSQ